MCYLKIIMLGILIFITFLSVSQEVFFCEDGKYNNKPQVLEEHIINLDRNPKELWKEIVIAKRTELIFLIEVFIEFDKDYFYGTIFNLVDNYLVFINNDMPSPFKEEIAGISEVSGIKTAHLVLYNIFYEIFTFCTSILAYDEFSSNQTLYHVRNMDFGIFLGWDIKTNKWKISEALRPLTVALDFRKSNITVYKAVSFVGYLGVLTAMKPGQFSLTVNERFAPDGGFLGIILWLLGLQKLNWLSFFTRNVMENAKSFEEAKLQLETSALIAPVYFILGGVNKTQANIITRSREGVIDDRNFTNCCDASFQSRHSNKTNFLFKLSESTKNADLYKNLPIPTFARRRLGSDKNFFQYMLEDIFTPQTMYKKLAYKLSDLVRNVFKRPNSNSKRLNDLPILNTVGNVFVVDKEIKYRVERNHPKPKSFPLLEEDANTDSLSKNVLQSLNLYNNLKRNQWRQSQFRNHMFSYANTSGEDYWFLLETNYDWWKTPFFIDNRRVPAIKCLKRTKLHKKIDFGSLYDVLSTRPILNKLTVYTTLMNVRDGIIETYVRDCEDPCPPW